MPPKVLVICGPTASGKTALAVEMALAYHTEVVSADSMQLYRHMDIGTAKPTAAEMAGVRHHMLDVADPGEDYSAARYVEAATACVDDILARGKFPIIAGGTGLYIESLLAGRSFAPFSGGQRDTLLVRLAHEGIEALYAELAQVDPARAARLHLKDEKRILRALEVFYETGETITAHDVRSQTLPPRYDALYIALAAQDRADLGVRIDQRVDQMRKNGLEQEVRNLLEDEISTTCTAMQAIGYKELAVAFSGGCPLDEAINQIKLRSRQYAKRQMTWFRHNKKVNWLLWEKAPNLSDARQKTTAFVEEFSIK